MTDREFVFIKGEMGYCQKVLNQWRHEFHQLNIISVTVFSIDFIVILVERSRKTPE